MVVAVFYIHILAYLFKFFSLRWFYVRFLIILGPFSNNFMFVYKLVYVCFPLVSHICFGWLSNIFRSVQHIFRSVKQYFLGRYKEFLGRLSNIVRRFNIF